MSLPHSGAAWELDRNLALYPYALSGAHEGQGLH